MGNNDQGFNYKQKNTAGGETSQTQEQPRQQYNIGTTAPGSRMRSRFDVDTSEVSSKIIENVNHILKTKVIDGFVKPISIQNSDKFKGLIVVVELDGTKYSQAIVIDERPISTVSKMLEESKATGAVLFGSALLSKENAVYLSAFEEAAKGTVRLESLILISEEYKTDESIAAYVKDIFKRIEVKPFNAIADDLAYDKSKPIIGQFSVDGQAVALSMAHKGTNTTIADMVVGNNDTILNIQARVEPILGAVYETVNGQQAPVAKARPIVWLQSFDRPGGFTKFNLEYALVSIVGATTFTRQDKLFTALLPNAVHKTNIGALNSLLPTAPDSKGNYEPLNLLDPKVATLEDKVDFIRRITAPAAIGISLDYRADGSAYNTFGGLIDAGNTQEALRKAQEDILEAYKNVTGLTYQGSVIERTIQAPSGVIISKQGVEKPLSVIDGIWLATNGMIEEARDWFISDSETDSFAKKLDIIKRVLVKTEQQVEIKVKCITSKIILSAEFVNALVKNSGFSVESRTEDIPLGNNNQTFVGAIHTLGVSTGVNTAAVTPFGTGDTGIKIIG